ncbi:hypothetical protein RCL1_006601 [Eukaryota sp. TZLM3-RCL]
MSNISLTTIFSKTILSLRNRLNEVYRSCSDVSESERYTLILDFISFCKSIMNPLHDLIKWNSSHFGSNYLTEITKCSQLLAEHAHFLAFTASSLYNLQVDSSRKITPPFDVLCSLSLLLSSSLSFFPTHSSTSFLLPLQSSSQVTDSDRSIFKSFLKSALFRSVLPATADLEFSIDSTGLLVITNKNLFVYCLTLDLRKAQADVQINHLVQSIKEELADDVMVTWKMIGLKFLFSPCPVITPNQGIRVLRKCNDLLISRPISPFLTVNQIIDPFCRIAVFTTILKQQELLDKTVKINHRVGQSSIDRKRRSESQEKSRDIGHISIEYWQSKFQSEHSIIITPDFGLSHHPPLTFIDQSNLNTLPEKLNLVDINIKNLVNDVINFRIGQKLSIIFELFNQIQNFSSKITRINQHLELSIFDELFLISICRQSGVVIMSTPSQSNFCRSFLSNILPTLNIVAFSPQKRAHHVNQLIGLLKSLEVSRFVNILTFESELKGFSVNSNKLDFILSHSKLGDFKILMKYLDECYENLIVFEKVDDLSVFPFEFNPLPTLSRHSTLTDVSKFLTQILVCVPSIAKIFGEIFIVLKKLDLTFEIKILSFIINNPNIFNQNLIDDSQVSTLKVDNTTHYFELSLFLKNISSELLSINFDGISMTFERTDQSINLIVRSTTIMPFPRFLALIVAQLNLIVLHEEIKKIEKSSNFLLDFELSSGCLFLKHLTGEHSELYYDSTSINLQSIKNRDFNQSVILRSTLFNDEKSIMLSNVVNRLFKTNQNIAHILNQLHHFIIVCRHLSRITVNFSFSSLNIIFVKISDSILKLSICKNEIVTIQDVAITIEGIKSTVKISPIKNLIDFKKTRGLTVINDNLVTVGFDSIPTALLSAIKKLIESK